MTTIERALYRAQRRRKTALPVITIVTAVLSFVMFTWSSALLLTVLTFLFTWGMLSSPIDQIEELRTIRRNR